MQSYTHAHTYVQVSTLTYVYTYLYIHSDIGTVISSRYDTHTHTHTCVSVCTHVRLHVQHTWHRSGWYCMCSVCVLRVIAPVCCSHPFRSQRMGVLQPIANSCPKHAFLLTLGWHYLSNAPCLTRLHSCYVCFVVSRSTILRYIIRHFWWNLR